MNGKARVNLTLVVSEPVWICGDWFDGGAMTIRRASSDSSMQPPSLVSTRDTSHASMIKTARNGSACLNKRMASISQFNIGSALFDFSLVCNIILCVKVQIA